MKKTLTINFDAFWNKFDKEDNLFYKVLSQKYNLKISNDPDVLFFSNRSKRLLPRRKNAVKIFYTGENQRPNFSNCDYAITFDYLNDPRHYRLPNWSRLSMDYFWKSESDIKKFLVNKKNQNNKKIKESKIKFCNFIYSNSNRKLNGVKNRIEFFHKLSEYKKVDSAGSVQKNVRYNIGRNRGLNKIKFMTSYKFTIAFENASYPGYTTEKIYHAFLANTVPIYWGDKLVHKEFNPKSFINCHYYKDFDSVIKKVIELDNNNALYAKYLKESCFNKIPNHLKQKNLLNFLVKSIEG